MEIWKKAQEINNGELVPQLIEYYYHNSDVAGKSFFMIIMEALDTSVTKAMKIADNAHNTALREILYEKVLSILRTLHSNGIAHGDSHLSNFMMKCDDKTIYEDETGDSLYKALLSGRCKVKVIDFGFSTTVETLTKNLDKELKILHRVGGRLFSIGCIFNFEETVFKEKAQSNIEEFFKIICFYDYALIKATIDQSYSNAKKLIYMYNVAEREIIGTTCDPNMEMDTKLSCNGFFIAVDKEFNWI